MTCGSVTAPDSVGSSTGASATTKVPSTTAVGKHRDCPAGEAGGLGSVLGRVAGALPQVSGAWGTGRVLTGTLFTVVITDDGRIGVGAVTPDVVYAALTRR
jgi:hypothetical protein